jgi:hypothetical protein
LLASGAGRALLLASGAGRALLLASGAGRARRRPPTTSCLLAPPSRCRTSAPVPPAPPRGRRGTADSSPSLSLSGWGRRSIRPNETDTGALERLRGADARLYAAVSPAAERRLRILERLYGAERGSSGSIRLCQVCAEVAGVSGAGIMLMSSDGPRGTVCTTDEISALIEDLQFTLGEGPCVDAFHQDRPVHEPDLADPVTPRWLAFSGPTLAAGVRAVFGYPLRVGAVRLGALNLYRDRPGLLGDNQHADVLMMADVAAQAVLVMHGQAPDGSGAAKLETVGDFAYVVHQASGMLAAQLDVGVAEALVRLRAFAFANDQPITAVADDLVARRLRFRDSPDVR